jgi:hypothetical protein
VTRSDLHDPIIEILYNYLTLPKVGSSLLESKIRSVLSMSTRKIPLQDDLKMLVEKAMEYPGIASVMEAYAKVEPVMATISQYLRPANLNTSFAVADTSSQ